MKKVDPKMDLPALEEETLAFWKRERIFERSVEKRQGAPEFTFYDGPPFATGTPHYGHLVPGAVKDAFPRFFTMRGFRVERRFGWDCHGLPIENLVEKELGFKSKKDILAYGVARFNEACRERVLAFADEWRGIMERFGRWADMEDAYRTMDQSYMESVWFVFKKLWDQGLIYESYRVMHVCPRCETTLSQAEVSEGYADVKDLAVTAKFELVDEPGTFLLAWTTTPWTLPGNVALAVGKELSYVRVRSEGTRYILAKERLEAVFGDRTYEVEAEFPGSTLVGRSYRAPFDDYQRATLQNHENGWKVYHADFVTPDAGTGIAHEAPAFGEEDLALGQQEHLPWVQHVNPDGTVKAEVKAFAGQLVKSKDNPQAFDVEIVKALAGKNLLFSKEKYLHSYPHCWRCDTPLVNYATTSWFVAVEKLKPALLENASGIRWSPEHLKTGRFGKWLLGARDWSISRQRFWASVLPIWKCEDCSALRVMGSAAELERASGRTVSDLHKHVVDEITLSCECGGMMRRVPDVLDTWFDSGSMPYGHAHYPFENEASFEERFPADFIAEGIDQTRAWFYYLHVIGTGIMGRAAFRNVSVNGVVLAEDGKKMSKKLKNYPDPVKMIEKYGADALRLYLLSSPVVSAENLEFSEQELATLSRNLFRMLWNSYSFFTTYAVLDGWSPEGKAKEKSRATHVLDRFILAELEALRRDVTGALESYDISRAARAFAPFVDDLSNWYIRRSRKRFWKSENDADKEAAYQTLCTVLVELAKLMAPFTPFLADVIYRNLTGEESVHLVDWPEEEVADEDTRGTMRALRALVTEGLDERGRLGIKVRQPLQKASLNASFEEEYLDILRDELNVKEILVDESQKAGIVLDATLTPELRLEGEARDIIRAIQEGRKKAGFNVEDRISLGYAGKEAVFEAFGKIIAEEVLAEDIDGPLSDAEYEERLEIGGEPLTISLKRV
jgi:isoleucyl-tRNA synthetase